MRVGDKSAEGILYVLSAKGAQFNASLGQRPRIHGTQKNAPALKARFTSESFHSIIDAMPQSLSKVIVHIIFSTKDREPWLGLDVRPRMHAYLATVCRDLGAEVVRVGGVADHVHIVTTLPRTVSQAELIEQIKKVSSKWIKTLDARYRSFFWQRGYGAFSVSPSQLEAYWNTLTRNKNTIALAPFRRNIASCFAGTASILTNDMSGIEKPRWIETRFQRLVSRLSDSWGAAPG